MEIRDPIHGFIQPEGIETELLDSMLMQRLLGIKQLALACLVYPGLHYTRFEHSLGAMHVADRMARAIGLPDHPRRLVRDHRKIKFNIWDSAWYTRGDD